MDVISYKCPNCAAGLAFNIESQNWHCEFCSSDFALEQLENPQEDTETSAAESHEHEMTEFTCPSCGGHIITDQNTAATFCVYCHNPTVIASRLEREFRPERVIPFKLKKEQVLVRLLALCRKRPLLPADFRSYAQKGEVSGLYVPFWLFDADIDAGMTATCRNITTWSDANYRYTKTDTYRVARAARIRFKGVPADGSKSMDDGLMEALEPFDYTQLVDFSMGYLSGHFAESYDVDADTAAKKAFPRIHTGVERTMRGLISGYGSVQVDNFNSTPKNVQKHYVMLPVWVLMADYKGKRYTFSMNGQTGKISGKLPLSMPRALAFFAGISAVATALCGLIMAVAL